MQFDLRVIYKYYFPDPWARLSTEQQQPHIWENVPITAMSTKGENSKYADLLIPNTAEGSLGNNQENRIASFL